MQLTITAKNLPTSPAVSIYAEKRLERVAKRMRREVPMRLVLRKEGTRSEDDRFVAELTMTLKGGVVLRAEERAGTPQAAIDLITDVIERQIRRYKTKRSRRRASLTEWESALLEELTPPQEVAEPVAAADGAVSELGDGRVVRTKVHQMAPMSVEEASTQMELLGHAFFVFLNAESNRINVLYRRWDGDYGLIVPDQTAAV